MTELEKTARQALEVLLDSIDDVRDCLNNILPHAGYARYDRRIEAYKEQIAKHEKAIADLTAAMRQAIEQQPAAPDWSDVSKLIEAASRASSSGYLTGTTNWASAVIKHLGAKPAAQWVGLTKENINHYVESRPYYGYCNEEYREGIEEGAKWAEAQLREKNWGKA